MGRKESNQTNKQNQNKFKVIPAKRILCCIPFFVYLGNFYYTKIKLD